MKTKFRVGQPTQVILEKTDETLLERAALLLTEMAKHPAQFPKAAAAAKAIAESRDAK